MDLWLGEWEFLVILYLWKMFSTTNKIAPSASQPADLITIAHLTISLLFNLILLIWFDWAALLDSIPKGYLHNPFSTSVNQVMYSNLKNWF